MLSLFAVSSAMAILGVLYSDDLGFSTSARALQKALAETRHTEHFVIRCAAGSFSSRELEAMADEHEFRLAQVCRDLDVRWEGKITTYVYPDNRVKRRLLGTETSQIARPWMREIHLSREGWRDALKHELVHVIASAFGPYLVRTPVFRAFGLTEGLAMAVEWDAGNRTPHQLAAAMLAQGMLPDAGRVISTGGFLTGASFSGYVASGSFCRWLIDAKGLAVMKDAYARDDVEAATGLSLERLDGEWRGFLGTVQRELPDSATTVWLFRRQSLFTKACPRAVTEKNREAAAAVAAGDDARAVRLFREADAMAPNPRAVYGMAAAFLRMGRVDSALALSARMLADPVRGPSLLPLWLWRGDAEWKRGNTAGADSCYGRIERERPGGWVEAEAREKRALIALPTLRDAAWRVYDLQSRPGADRDSVRAAAVPLLREAFRADSGANLSRLLLARWLRHDTLREAEAARVLRATVPGPFFFESSMLAGDILLRIGDISAAKAQYERALAAATMESERLAARDALERCAWKSAGTRGIAARDAAARFR
ncbi:MAG: hypothetical protein IPP94_03940 [Ignavibacteria bacterium]|nr:hypothetical protein [Ignavibacteria bacterium]